MSSREGGIRVRRAISTATGNISAATPMLFMKAESTPAVSMIMKITRSSPLPATLRTVRPMIFAIPVLVSPSLRMNIAHTAITAALLKPETACSGVTSPKSTSKPRTIRATTSMRNFSLMNRMSEITNMVRTNPISIVNAQTSLLAAAVRQFVSIDLKF